MTILSAKAIFICAASVFLFELVLKPQLFPSSLSSSSNSKSRISSSMADESTESGGTDNADFSIQSETLSSDTDRFRILAEEKTKTKTEMLPVSWAEAIEHLQHSSEFRHLLTLTLQKSRFDAFFWETVPVTATNARTRTFEFVLRNSRELRGLEADVETFSSYFADAGGAKTDGEKESEAGDDRAAEKQEESKEEEEDEEKKKKKEKGENNGKEGKLNDKRPRITSTKPTVISFLNLGKDALLVVPRAMHKEKVVAVDTYAHLAAFVRHAPAQQVDEFWKVLGESIAKRLDVVSPKKMWVSTSGLGVSWLHARLDSIPKYYGYMPYKHDTVDDK